MGPATAIVLAAGLGQRIREVVPDRPKCLIDVGGERLLERSVRLLQARGVRRIVVVTGYRDADVRSSVGAAAGVEFVRNPEFAATGTMASLACALRSVTDDFVLLEGDLYFEAAALDPIFAGAAGDLVLASTPTDAGDEVWIEAPEGRLRGMSKDGGSLRSIDGELVGICRISAELGAAMAATFAEFKARCGHGQMSYEEEALVACARVRPVPVEILPDLLWGELDDGFHLTRLREVVAPAVHALEGAPPVRRQPETA